MKRLVILLLVLSAFLFHITSALADDATDVKAAVLESQKAMNAGNATAAAQYVHPERSIFFYGGQLLMEQFDASGLKAAFDAGLKFNWDIRHLDVKVYGDGAIVTGYNVGTITSADGTTHQGSRRFSEFWTKSGGKWLQVHRHASHVLPPESQ
jgi:ketosteroid isomerase-like protein